MKNMFVLTLLCSMALLSCYKPRLAPGETDITDPGNARKLNALALITYYVATNGDDANDGSLSAPFRTINHALSVAMPGDEVQLRGGTYIEKVVFPRSGTKGNFITLKEFPGETAIISGSGLTVSGTEGLLTIDSLQYIAVDGLDICHFESSSGHPIGVLVTNGGGFIEIRNNHFYSIDYEGAAGTGGSNAILMDGNTADELNEVVISGNTIHDCKTGLAENVAVSGHLNVYTISGNTIYNCENTAISAKGAYAGGSFVQPFKAYINTNVIYNVSQANGAIGGNGATAILLNGTDYAAVDRNRIYDADRGIGITSETAGFPGKNSFVNNNFIYNCWRSGIYLGAEPGSSSAGNTNSYIYNNTLFFNNRITGSGGEIEGEISIRDNSSGVTVRNSIIYTRPSGVFIRKYDNTGSGTLFTHNLYYAGGTPQWVWNGAVNTSLTTWKTLVGGLEGLSTSGVDPLLVNSSATTPDLHIQPGSPARNTGTNPSSLYTGLYDIDSQNRGISNIDKGADEVY
jgi:hypothetical protein